MIALAAAIAGFVACQYDEPNRPQPPRFNADSVQLLSTCGADFLVRNANDISVMLTWDVEGADKAGQLTLPARERGKPYSEVSLRTERHGKTRLFYQGTLIESNESVGVTCVGRNEVPASAPDYYPAEILGLAPTMHDPDSPSLRYQRGIVTVVFVDGVSLLDRQLIIASIGAIVIGGVPGGAEEGEYILKLVADTSLRATKNAVTILRSNAKVRFAGPNLVASPMYRRPNDGPGWRSWKISLGGAASDSSNWALEDIAAPLAWGCETGTTAIKVAVIDEYFFALADLSPNLNAGASKGVGSFPTHANSSAHGTRVLSILAARGNNDTGMTGVAWSADVRAYDLHALGLVADTSLALTDLAINNAISQAVTAGAQIVNISLGELWQLPGGGVEPIPSAGAAAEVATTKERMQRALNRLVAAGHDPLLVVSAGNREGLDAALSRIPAVAADPLLRSRILVVGGSTRQRTRWRQNSDFGSGVGPLVDLSAPAEGVSSLDGSDSITVLSGISFSAPFVSGVAALLKSFDPSLTATQLRSLILAGTVGTVTQPSGPAKPILNAYGALKKAAERTGAPLCGSQRLWGNHGTGKIIVERVRGSAASDDTLGAVDPDQMNVIFAKHGGKGIQFSSEPNANGLIWSPSGWITGTPAPNDGGILPQYFGGSHDGDSTVAFMAPGGVTEIGIWKPGDVYEMLRSPYVASHSLPSCSGICVYGGNAFISPVKQQIWLSGGVWGLTGPTADSYIEVFDMVTKAAPTLFKTYSGKLIFNVNQSEDGTELRVRLWVPPGNTCEYDFISLVPPDSGQVRRTVTGTAPPPLGGVYCKDDGTFSPRIAPSGAFSTGRTSKAAWMRSLQREP